MTGLPQLNCRGCGSPLVALPAGGRVRAATRFDDCLRRCETCGVGASNTENADAVTWIYRNPLDNIPGECHRGALDALGRAFNTRNRESKRRRFGFFPSSKDA